MPNQTWICIWQSLHTAVVEGACPVATRARYAGERGSGNRDLEI